jgi:hypothetical protein
LEVVVADRPVLEEFRNIRTDAVQKRTPLPNNFHVHIERPRKPLLGYPTLQSTRDHMVLLNRREPVHALVVSKGLVVTGDDAGRFDSPLGAQGIESACPSSSR